MTELYEIQRVKIKINNLMTNLKESAPDDYLKKLEDAEKEINEEFEKTTQVINVDPATTQAYHYHIAGWITQPDARRYWYLYNAIGVMLRLQSVRTLLIKIFKEKPYEAFTENYKRNLRYYENIRHIIDKIEPLTIKEVEKELQKQDNAFNRLEENLKKTVPMNNDLFSVYHIINLYTSLGSQQVPAQTIQTIIKTEKKIVTDDQQTNKRNITM
jgi:hypothetical protein